MASYTEILQLFSVKALREQVQVGIADVASEINAEPTSTPNHTERVKWAASALNNSQGEASKFLLAVLVANKSATVTQILNATDTTVLNNVRSFVDLFAVAEYG